MPQPDEYSTSPRVVSGLPALAVLEATGAPLSFGDRLRLNFARLTGGLESSNSLPRQVFGVPVRGQERVNDLIEFFRPYVSNPNFGKDPRDAEELLDAFGKKTLGLGPVEQQQASNLLKVYRRAVAKRQLAAELPGLFEPEEPQPETGLSRFIR